MANFYAPHNGRAQNERIKFFEDASDELESKNKYKKFVALGDWNPRLRHRREGEEDHSG